MILENMELFLTIALATPITFCIGVLALKLYGMYRREKKHW